MALEHAILVSLAERTSTGYELSRRFDKSIGQFWTASHQQVYSVLARMETDGWLAVDPCRAGRASGQEGLRPHRCRPRRTRAWIGRPAEPEATRSELAVKIRGASFGDCRPSWPRSPAPRRPRRAARVLPGEREARVPRPCPPARCPAAPVARPARRDPLERSLSTGATIMPTRHHPEGTPDDRPTRTCSRRSTSASPRCRTGC